MKNNHDAISLERNSEFVDPDPVTWFMAVCTGISAMGALHQMITERRSSAPTRSTLVGGNADLALTQLRQLEDAVTDILVSTRRIRELMDQADFRMEQNQRDIIPFRFGQMVDGFTPSDLTYLKDQISSILKRVTEINIRSKVLAESFASSEIPQEAEFLESLGGTFGELNDIFFSGEYSIQAAEYRVIEILERIIRSIEGMRKAIQQRGGK